MAGMTLESFEQIPSLTVADAKDFQHYHHQSRRGRPRSLSQMGEFDLSLIVEFRSRPCLYDRNSSQFKDKLYNAQQWQEISNKLGYDVSILKDRMLQLRNRYNLEKRRMEQLREENPQKFVITPWALYDSLQFLSDHIKARRRYKNMPPVGTGQKDEHNSFLHDSLNDYSALGTDDAALEAAKDEARFMGQPFPNALLAVKVEENLSGDQASDAESDRSHNNESETNIFGDNSNVMTEIHSITKYRQQRRQQLNKHQQLQQQLQQQHLQQQHLLRQQLLLRQQQHHQQQLQRMQRNHSTPLSTNGMTRGSIANDLENQMPLQQSTAKKRPFTQLSTSNQDNDAAAQDSKRLAYNIQKPQRLSPRELKYNAFGSFVSSSLLDLPQKMALELVEKFTSDIVKALTMKMDSMEENITDAPVEQ